MRVLQRRLRHQGSAAIPQGLIHWSGQPETLATWKDLDDLRRRFPRAPAWGQAGSQGGGSVSSATGRSTGDGPAQKEEAAQLPKRVRKPSDRYPSSSWVVK